MTEPSSFPLTPVSAIDQRREQVFYQAVSAAAHAAHVAELRPADAAQAVLDAAKKAEQELFGVKEVL